MRLLPFPLAAVAGIALFAIAQNALAADPSTDYRRSMGNLRPDHRTAAPAIQGSPPPRGRTNAQVFAPVPPVGHPTPYHHGPSYGYDRRYYQPNYGYRYPQGYNYGYGYGYGYPRTYYRGYVYPPPIYLPAERLYGPQAVKRFMGVAP